MGRYRRQFMAEGVSCDADPVPLVLVSEHVFLQPSVQLSRILGEACRYSVSQIKKDGQVPRGTKLGMQ